MSERIRIAILWQQLSSHTSACFNALASEGAEVLLIHRAATSDAPFDDNHLRGRLRSESWVDAPDEAALSRTLSEFNPHVTLVSSWNVGGYRRLSKSLRGRTLRVLCMDNSWLGTAKQWSGRLISRAVVRPTYDVVLLPGERQAMFAGRLGFDATDMLWGLYCCADDFFVTDPPTDPPERFLFVGRLVPEKGVDVLAAAYRDYRRAVEQPWPLLVCGTGPLASVLTGIEGVEVRGFVQPTELPAVYREAGCLVLPSRFEPWGVAIHEACSGGLAVIASTACGATTRLVLDGFNGVLIPPDNTDALARALARLSRATPTERRAMAAASVRLAGQFTPKRWAQYLLERVPDLRARHGMGATPAPLEGSR